MTKKKKNKSKPTRLTCLGREITYDFGPPLTMMIKAENVEVIMFAHDARLQKLCFDHVFKGVRTSLEVVSGLNTPFVMYDDLGKCVVSTLISAIHEKTNKINQMIRGKQMMVNPIYTADQVSIENMKLQSLVRLRSAITKE